MLFLEKLWKMWENRDVKLIIPERRRKYLVSESNYHTIKFFTENLLANKNEKMKYLWIILSV